MRKLVMLLLSLAASLGIASSGLAIPVSYQLQNGSEDGFAYSYIHDAQNGDPFAMSGALLFELSGTLTGDFDGTTLVLDPDQLFSASLKPKVYDDHVLVIEAGELFVSGGFAGGWIDYVLQDEVTGDVLSDSVLYLEPMAFPGGPNTLSATSLRLWGNNWDNTTNDWDQLVADGLLNSAPEIIEVADFRLGMDIVGVAVPEPGAALLFAAGALVTGARVRRGARR